ncbi:MAG: hypothetical protein RI900_427, partial [Actinomycetota bacterium]
MTGSSASVRRPWLTRNLLLLTVVSFTQDAASELLYPLLPLLLTGVLAAPPVVLGVIEGLADATAGVTRYVSGRWSDRRGRRPFITAGYGFAALGKALVALAVSWPVVLLGRVVDRFGKGVRSAPRDALIAATTAPEHRGRAFGFHRTGDTLGAVIGPLLGLWALAALGNDVRAALWWAVVPAVLSMLLTLLVREPAVAGASGGAAAALATAPDQSVSSGGIPPAPLPSQYRRVVGLLVLVALVNFSDALLLLRALQLGFSTTEVVLAYVVFNSVYTLGSYPAGALTDRWPRQRVYAVGLVAFGVAYLGLGMVSGGWPVFALMAVYGLFPAFTDGVGKAWVSSLVPEAHLGRALGVH